MTIPTPSKHGEYPEQPPEIENDCVPMPPLDQQNEKTKDRVSMTPSDRQSEEKEDRVPTPPLGQPLDEDTMSYPYPKYRDDPYAEAHVYAFLQTWEANHVSQRLTDTEVEYIRNQAITQEIGRR